MKRFRKIAKQFGKNARRTLIKLTGNKNPKIGRIIVKWKSASIAVEWIIKG